MTKLLGIFSAVAALIVSPASCPAGASKASFGLRLGVPRIARDATVAIPVILRMPHDQAVAALNFTVRYDSTRFAAVARGVTAGASVTRARAELASRTDEVAGAIRVIVVPEFSRDFETLRGRRIATLYLRGRQGSGGGLLRLARRHVHLDDVVLGDAEGRTIRPRRARKGGQS